jgi:hypothetical protein
MKTLKYEEVYRTEYRNLSQARAAIGEFLEQVYNEKRLLPAFWTTMVRQPTEPKLRTNVVVQPAVGSSER